MITENQLEQLCIEWFQSIDYSYVCGYDIAPGGADEAIELCLKQADELGRTMFGHVTVEKKKPRAQKVNA
ncbi:MAG: hypothetical protein COA42_22290 [Alteromonadaceae bacterium]|nr:MAG: hypothetical protein COA42_22290 [Alteromonadaceae bacterium]